MFVGTGFSLHRLFLWEQWVNMDYTTPRNIGFRELESKTCGGYQIGERWPMSASSAPHGLCLLKCFCPYSLPLQHIYPLGCQAKCGVFPYLIPFYARHILRPQLSVSNNAFNSPELFKRHIICAELCVQRGCRETLDLSCLTGHFGPRQLCCPDCSVESVCAVGHLCQALID